MPYHQPDILFIVLDTVRRDRLSIYGNAQETTPAFDGFAADATLFERAISPAQWTVPAHASMFTGLYPTTHRVTQSNSKLAAAYPTLAELLRAQGYHTAGFCNNPLVGVLENDLKRGFSAFYNYAGAAPSRPQDAARGPVRRALSRAWRRFAMQVSQQFAHSDWLFRHSLHPLLVPIWTRSINYKGHTERSVNDLIEYLATRRSSHPETPHFTFLNLMSAHLPYRPPQGLLDRFAPELSRDKAAYQFMARFNADAARWASPVDEPLSAFQSRVIEGYYDAEIAHQDQHLGRLLDALRSSGALEDTMVIITADHGEGHGDHGYFGHSFVVYQELVHVPLAIRYPAKFPGARRIKTNVSTRRLFHTVLDAAGVRIPEWETNTAPDLSLVQTLNGQPDVEGDLAFAEAFPPLTFLNVLKHRNPGLIEQLKLRQVRRGVYHKAHKLAIAGTRVEGLFNLNADPQEIRDVAALNQQRVTELQAHIDTFVQQAEAARLDGPPDVYISETMIENLRALGYIE